ncbi:MAG: YwiC-like family protein [Planctomycetaceae bacterium]
MSVESPCIAESQPRAFADNDGVEHGVSILPNDASSNRSVSHVKLARLHPKEHGAYFVLAIPLVVSLFIAGLTPTTLSIAIAAFAAFLAHEPLLIVAGSRGNRVRESTPAAARTLVVRIAVTVVCGTTAFWLGGQSVRLGLITCIVFSGIQLVVSTKGYSRTLGGQILGIAGLTLPSAVVLLAGGIELAAAVQFWLMWFAGRMATTVSVRSAITHHKSSASLWATRTCDILLAIAFAVCAVGLFRGSAIWFVTLPLLLAASVLRFFSPHPRHLKQVGWSLLVVNTISGIIAIGIWNY